MTTAGNSMAGYGSNMSDEVQGERQPLVRLLGVFSANGTACGARIPGLSASREVITFDLQGTRPHR